MRIVAPLLLALVAVAAAVSRAEDPACTRYGSYPRSAYVTPPPLRTASRPKIEIKDAAKPGVAATPESTTEILNLTTAAKECEAAPCTAKKNCEAGACTTGERPKATAAKTACDQAGNCDKAVACEKSNACAKTAACDKKSACTGVTATAAESVCAKAKACAATKACKSKSACEDLKAVAEAACTEKAACASKTACSARKACGEKTAVAVAESSFTGKCACADTKACADNAACAESCDSAIKACPLAVATDHATECTGGTCLKKICRESAIAGCDQTAKSCAKLAVASDQACEEVEEIAIASPACTASPCASQKCSTEARLAHLYDAADHLTLAGLVDQADSVRAVAAKLRHELVARKVAQIASLQAEIAELGGACESTCQTPLSATAEREAPGCESACEELPACEPDAPGPMTVSQWMAMPQAKPAAPKQVALHVEVVEVSISKLKELGFDVASLGTPGSCGPMTCAKSGQSGFVAFLDALKRERLVKVLAEPTLVVTHGRPASFTNGGVVRVPVARKENRIEFQDREFGTHIDVVTSQIDDKRIRVEIRPRVTQLQEKPGEAGPRFLVQAIDTGFEVELGTTTVLGGQVCRRDCHGTDPQSHELAQSEVQTLFLVTPYSVDSQGSAVTPASHSEPSKTKPAKRSRIPMHWHSTGMGGMFGHGELPSITFSVPDEAK